MSVFTVIAALLSGIISTYQIARIRVFFNQDSVDPQLASYVYQPRNAMQAIATGGLSGKGWLQGAAHQLEGLHPGAVGRLPVRRGG